MIFRTSSSQEEGGTREFAFRTTHLEGTGSKLVALHGDRVALAMATLVDLRGTERAASSATR